jgi:hypothetical protein
MKKLPTAIAEKVYEVLTKFAEASQNYYDRESFIYHFGVVSNTSNSYNLVCMDDSRRVFTCTRDGRMWVDGKGSSRVNAILRKISKELKNEEEVAGFTVTKNEI